MPRINQFIASYSQEIGPFVSLLLQASGAD